MTMVHIVGEEYLIIGAIITTVLIISALISFIGIDIKYKNNRKKNKNI